MSPQKLEEEINEQKKLKKQKKLEKKKIKWAQNNYISKSIILKEQEEEENILPIFSEINDESYDIQFVKGDVTKPQVIFILSIKNKIIFRDPVIVMLLLLIV